VSLLTKGSFIVSVEEEAHEKVKAQKEKDEGKVQCIYKSGA
jgi:hypothetical protein